MNLSVHSNVGPLASKQIHESSLSCGCCGSMSQCHVQWLGSVGLVKLLLDSVSFFEMS